MVKEQLKQIHKGTSPPVQLVAEIGTEMQVEIENIDRRIKLTMVGIVPKQYLIYSLPAKIVQSAGKKALKANTSVNIRSISRGTAFGFNSAIISYTKNPFNLLFINYPKKIQQQTIRKNQRVKCLLPAKLSRETISVKGTLADISSSGCHFQTKKSKLTDQQIKLFQSKDEITVALSFPGMGGKKLLSALIKNTFSDSDKAQIGIEFINIDNSTVTLLENFVAMSFDLPPF